MKHLKTAGALAAAVALSFTLAGCSSSPTVESDDEGSTGIEQDDGTSSSTSSNSRSSNSGSSSKSSSSYKSYDDDDDYSHGSNSSSGSTSERRQTYAQTDPDGWSYMEYNDGSAEITDGWGMVARDTDGDGELDKISTDSGESWDDFE